MQLKKSYRATDRKTKAKSRACKCENGDSQGSLDEGDSKCQVEIKIEFEKTSRGVNT